MSNEALIPLAIPIPGGGWQGALADGEIIIWQCDHYHVNKVKSLPGAKDYPERRSARGCAFVELSRRERK